MQEVKISQVFEILCLCFESSELLDDLKYSQEIFKTDQEHHKKIMPKSGALFISKDAQATALASHLYPLIAKEDLLNNFKGSVCAFCETAREKNLK